MKILVDTNLCGVDLFHATVELRCAPYMLHETCQARHSCRLYKKPPRLARRFQRFVRCEP
jgi:hypothetical protein